MRLVLIRHGQTASNTVGALDTAYPGAPLNAVGRREAQELVTKWTEVVGEAGPHQIFVSPLRRTRQTALPLATSYGLRPVERAGLREIVAGELEMRTDAEAVGEYLRCVVEWAAGRPDRRLPGGDDGHRVLGRFLPVIGELAEKVGEDGTGVLVAHGAIIRVVAAHLAPEITPDFIAAHPLANTGMVVLTGSVSAGWQATHWSDRPIGEWSVPVGATAGPVPSVEYLKRFR